MPDSWSEEEVRAIVEDYFNMLACELRGEVYNKAEHNRGLINKLNHRSHSSVERKHQNISAVLIEMGCPYISGYKPLVNYQRKLFPDIVSEMLADNALLL